MNINKKYFVIQNNDKLNYYIIPEDKEGEKVKFIDKKSINELLSIRNNDNLFNINDISFTIQLFSDINYTKVENYLNNLLKLKPELVSPDDLFIISVDSDIGTDYFLTFKNFLSYTEAISYCKKLSFIKKCLILNPQN